MNSSAPFPAYQGDQPFIFASYAHADAEVVYAELRQLHDLGYRIWYDEGINPGVESFSSVLLEALLKAEFFVVFLSPNSAQLNGWVEKELSMAIQEKKEKLLVYITETQIPQKWEFIWRLAECQALKKNQPTPAEYLSGWMKALKPKFKRAEPPRPSTPLEDFIAEISSTITSSSPLIEKNLLELAGILGIEKETARRTLQETLEKNGIEGFPVENEKLLRQLICTLLRGGPLRETSMQLLANQAKRWGISETRWRQMLREESQGGGAAATGGDVAVQQAATAVRAQVPVLAVPDPPMIEKRIKQPVGAVTDRAETILPGGVKMMWVSIPAGPFVRGCPPEFTDYVRREYRIDAQVLETYPLRKETLPDFWIGAVPVTNAQFFGFVSATGHRFPADWRGTEPPYPSGEADHPVTGITWQDGVNFAVWLGARLPSRAEYEKACRGNEGRIFPWGDKFDASLCNTVESRRDKLLPVGAMPEKAASPFGVLDMVGNVWQWAQDESRPGFRMSVGASFKCTGELYGPGFFDLSREPASVERDLGFRVACVNLEKLSSRTKYL